MSGKNLVIIIGNLGNDPDTSYMPNGNAVTKISVATSQTWKDKESGEKKERTEWHRIIFFNRLAEIAGEYLTKGSKVYIEGALRTSSYDKEGQKHYSTEIIAREMQMLSEPRYPPAHTSRGEKAPGPSAPDKAAPPEDFDDDIPF